MATPEERYINRLNQQADAHNAGASKATGSRPPGYIIDVPVTLSVAVRGVSRTRAQEIAREFADGMSPSQEYVDGFSGQLSGGATVTEVSFESSREDACEVEEELDQEEEEVTAGEPETCVLCRNLGHACIDHEVIA